MKTESHEVLWEPSEEFKSDSNISRYISWLNKSKNHKFSDYQSLWRWSINQPEEFWSSLLKYFKVQYSGQYKSALKGTMPEVKWFEGICVNFAEHVFRNKNENYPAIIYASETREIREVSWVELESSVAALAVWLRELGVGKGDRVAAYIHNGPEAIIGFLAANSLGAIWSSTSPDFGPSSVLDRFRQIQPKVLLATCFYTYNGKNYDKRDTINSIVSELDSVEKVILVNAPLEDPSGGIKKPSVLWEDTLKKSRPLQYERVPFNEPIWILYSSGTTGLPKPITHSQGGILIEHLKYLSFHNNIKTGDRCFWYTTTGWMMWNYIQSSLLVGGTVVLYDGSPVWPDINVLWDFASKTAINHFGTSAGFIIANEKKGIKPSKNHDLSKLVSVGSTGSPLPPEGFKWLYKNVKEDLWVSSISGGTDVCSAFVGGNPLWPVNSGEIQCRALGCSLESWDEEGNSLKGEVGEMVITKPMPSMPVYFWGDDKFKRYKESYFEVFDKVWRHGDWTEITDKQGVIIYGRSDSTLNKGGVRIGTSEIYRAVDSLEEISDSIIISIENKTGDFLMPLFVVLKEGIELNTTLQNKIRKKIREMCSPRHVPDNIVPVDEVPYTISGKKVETPVKRILMGADSSNVLNKDALRNPKSLSFFKNYRKEIQEFINN